MIKVFILFILGINSNKVNLDTLRVYNTAELCLKKKEHFVSIAQKQYQQVHANCSMGEVQKK